MSTYICAHLFRVFYFRLSYLNEMYSFFHQCQLVVDCIFFTKHAILKQQAIVMQYLSQNTYARHHSHNYKLCHIYVNKSELMKG